MAPSCHQCALPHGLHILAKIGLCDQLVAPKDITNRYGPYMVRDGKTAGEARRATMTQAHDISDVMEQLVENPVNEPVWHL